MHVECRDAAVEVQTDVIPAGLVDHEDEQVSSDTWFDVEYLPTTVEPKQGC